MNNMRRYKNDLLHSSTIFSSSMCIDIPFYGASRKDRPRRALAQTTTTLRLGASECGGKPCAPSEPRLYLAAAGG